MTKQCTVDGCDRVQYAKGLCDPHYKQKRRRSPLDAPIRERVRRTCTVDGCDRPHSARGLCHPHYKQKQKGVLLDAPIRERVGTCSVDGCDRNQRASGLCVLHYQQKRLGTPMDVPINEVPIGERRIAGRGYVRVKMIRGNGESGWKLEHRFVMEQHLGRELYPHEEVHHLNGVRNDNRLENLELWTSCQPSGQRVADKLAWAEWFIAQYANQQLTLDFEG